MKQQKVRLLETVKHHGDAMLAVTEPGDVSLVVRGRPRSLVCNCPCGCGSVITLNLDIRSGKAWSLYRRQDKISLYPSVWRDSGCESHFIVWKNRIIWFDEDWWIDDASRDDLGNRILPLIPEDEAIHFRDVADMLDEIPWTILSGCRQLVRNGVIIEVSRKDFGYFKKNDKSA